MSRPIVSSALRIALVVGTLLSGINQGLALFAGDGISWTHVLLNRLVPYCVATSSAASSHVSREKAS